jgi:hypothetical protein
MNEMSVDRALVEALSAQSKGTFAVPELLREQAVRGEPWTLREVKLEVEGPIAIITEPSAGYERPQHQGLG